MRLFWKKNFATRSWRVRAQTQGVISNLPCLFVRKYLETNFWWTNMLSWIERTQWILRGAVKEAFLFEKLREHSYWYSLGLNKLKFLSADALIADCLVFSKSIPFSASTIHTRTSPLLALKLLSHDALTSIYRQIFRVSSQAAVLIKDLVVFCRINHFVWKYCLKVWLTNYDILHFALKFSISSQIKSMNMTESISWTNSPGIV